MARELHPRGIVPAEAPLKDSVIVEAGNGLALAFAGHLLASFGATVIKVHDPNQRASAGSDGSRIAGPGSRMDGFLNAGKLSVSLDPHSLPGSQLLYEVERRSDLVLRFWEPGEQSPASSSEAGPSRIDISWLGRSGPWSEFACDDFLAQHVSGMAFTSALRMTDPSTSPPRAVPGHLAEMVAGLTAAAAGLVALVGVGANDRTDQVDISVAECIVSFLRYETVIYSYGWGLPSRSKLARSPVAAPVFQQPVADGFVDMLIMREEPWRALLEIIGSPTWADDEVFATHPSRSEFWDALEPLLREEMSKFSAQDLYEEGQRRGIAISPINTIQQAAKAEQFAERGFFQSQATRDGQMRVPGPPFKLGPLTNLAPAPGLGEHNLVVLRDWLGLSESELAEARVI